MARDVVAAVGGEHRQPLPLLRARCSRRATSSASTPSSRAATAAGIGGAGTAASRAAHRAYVGQRIGTLAAAGQVRSQLGGAPGVEQTLGRTPPGRPTGE